MTDLVIQFNHSSANDSCTVCGEAVNSGDGLQLYRANSGDVVCRRCGKDHAPSLVALMDLAHTATRVGKIGRHTVVPPITSLLDLARAAENYTLSAPIRRRQVA